jgi:hypothetical protein
MTGGKALVTLMRRTIRTYGLAVVVETIADVLEGPVIPRLAALVTDNDGFVGTVLEQSRRGGVLCQWLDVEPDDYLTHLRGFPAADLCSVGGV